MTTADALVTARDAWRGAWRLEELAELLADHDAISFGVDAML